jgi:F-type H+-transporting ATPase subunit gamma
MANLKEVRNRIASVNSTQQITKAMKMVAAAKLRKAQDNITRIRPYADKLNGVLINLYASLGESFENPYAEVRDVQKVLVVVVTSDRGLAGAFNSNVIKSVNNMLAEEYPDQLAKGNVTLLTIGKKGNDAFAKSKINKITDHALILNTLNFNTARKASEYAMNAYLNKEYDRVILVYNEFKNAATQILQNLQFLPVVKLATPVTKVQDAPMDFIFEPSTKEIVKELIPKSLRVQFYKALLDSLASEHGARMTAMDKATENAKEMLKALRLEYNRSRQAAITTEILEIVAGAEALNG